MWRSRWLAGRMALVRMWAVAAACGVLLAVAPAALSVADGPLVFVDEPLPPLSLGQMGQVAEGGITLELLQSLFGRLGREVRLELMPWARAMKTVETGRADGVPLLMKTPEREAFLVYTEAVVEDREYFFYLAEGRRPFTWSRFDDLQGFCVGLVSGYTYGPDFLRARDEGKFRVEYAPDAETNFRKLLAGRIDLVLEGEFQSRGVMDANPQWRDLVAAARPAVSTYQWYIGLSRLRPAAALVADINRVLADMRADGSLDRICGRQAD